jgi:Na+(H+)/acetate symporter ActP
LEGREEVLSVAIRSCFGCLGKKKEEEISRMISYAFIIMMMCMFKVLFISVFYTTIKMFVTKLE